MNNLSNRKKLNIEESESTHWFQTILNDDQSDEISKSKSNVPKSASTPLCTSSNEYYEIDIDSVFVGHILVNEFDIVYCEKSNKIVFRIPNQIESITIEQLLDTPDDAYLADNQKSKSTQTNKNNLNNDITNNNITNNNNINTNIDNNNNNNNNNIK